MSPIKTGDDVNITALQSEIRSAIMNKKVNACPIAIRLAWHASGTYNKHDKTGGSNGARMRFHPEKDDEANADLWAVAGASAFQLGRTDDCNGEKSPPPGRLPDASKGAQHLRDVFYRMGFNDQEIVALSGAHTLGRCHLTRSGFDGPYWTPRQWEGNFQYADPSEIIMIFFTIKMHFGLKNMQKMKNYFLKILQKLMQN
eukprot:GSMAST32.ASY1.ANO1.292.1 assembled CDS